MIIISTPSAHEARIAANAMRQVQARTGISYRIFVLGREVAAFDGSTEILHFDWPGERLPDLGLPHPGNRAERSP